MQPAGPLSLRTAFSLFVAAPILSVSVLGPTASPAPLLQSRDAGRLRTGSFQYRDLNRGSAVGRDTITIHRLPDSLTYQFSSSATFDAAFSGFHSQRWEAVATRTFAPVSAQLAFVAGNQAFPAFDLHYADGRVRGFVVHHVNSSQASRSVVDAPLPADVVDQRIDWAAAMSADLTPGRSFTFSVFDPGSGVSQVNEKVIAEAPVQVPAGSFAAYQLSYSMAKPDRTETFRLLVTQAVPRMMLREEFPNGEVSELVRAEDK